MESRVRLAQQKFKNGFNCAQSVFSTYSDLLGVDEGSALKLAHAFGAGIAREQEVCGAGGA